MNIELTEASEMSIQQSEISNQIEEDVPVPSTSNLTLPDPIVIRRRVLSDEEKEILKKLDQHTEFLPASFVEELLMELKNYSNSWTKKQIRDCWYNKYKRNKNT